MHTGVLKSIKEIVQLPVSFSLQRFDKRLRLAQKKAYCQLKQLTAVISLLALAYCRSLPPTNAIVCTTM